MLEYMKGDMMKEKLTELLKDIGLSLSDEQFNMFEIYYHELVEWNEKVNLTAITEKSDVYFKHFYDSLMISRIIHLDKQLLLDVGSGAGFPSLPLKIMFPGIHITIIDSSGKRIAFLQHLTQLLGLQVDLINNRIENHKLKNHYDIVTARAVAPLNILTELCLPFVKVDGKYLPMKSRNWTTELEQSQNAINVLGGEYNKTFDCHYLEYERNILEITKIKLTPPNYPRDYGKIKKTPL